MRFLVRPGSLASVIACVLAVCTTALSLHQLGAATPIRPLEDPAGAFTLPSVPVLDSIAIAAGIDLDPFRPERMAAATRYGLAHLGVATDGPVAMAPTIVILLGTVMRHDGSGFALCQTGDEPSRLVLPGQRIGGLTLRRVEQAKAMFETAEGVAVTLTVSRGGTS